MAAFGLSCIIIVMLALSQGVPLSEIIATIVQDVGGK
jgi:hypothetical protein